MTDDIVSSETAKVLKEKGFDVRTETFYCENYEGVCYYSLDGEVINYGDGKHYYDINCEFEEGEKWYRPTQSLAQKWLRETFNIHLEITMRDREWCGWIYEIPYDGYLDTETDSFEGSSFKETLESGLQKALSIIN